MTSLSSVEPLICLSAPPRRPPVPSAGPWQRWWRQRGISGSSWTTPLAPSGLFGDAVNSFVNRYQEARKQAVAFQQFRFSAGLTHSTLKVYVAALSPYHPPLGGQSVGRHPLVTRFLLRLRPPARELVLSGGSGCYPIASSLLISPLLGDLTHFSEVGLRDAAPPTLATLGPLSLALAVLHPH